MYPFHALARPNTHSDNHRFGSGGDNRIKRVADGKRVASIPALGNNFKPAKFQCFKRAFVPRLAVTVILIEERNLFYPASSREGPLSTALCPNKIGAPAATSVRCCSHIGKLNTVAINNMDIYTLQLQYRTLYIIISHAISYYGAVCNVISNS